MPRFGETTLVLHGLDVDNRVVRADTFVRKLRTLLTALRAADKFANGKTMYTYMVTGLETGSAGATIREKQKTHDRPLRSSVDTFETVADAIYNADRSIEQYPAPLVRHFQKLGEGVAKQFSHAELKFTDNNVIRIDDFLLRQSNEAYKVLTVGKESRQRFFRGLATGTFDGVLKEIDARGTMLRGKLVLSTGNVEIDCVMNKERVPEARESFDKRVIVDGTAHYSGESPLPERVDIRNIRVIDKESDLLRWRGAFAPSVVDAEKDWAEDW